MAEHITCRLCGSSKLIEYHHVFGGAYRGKSTKLGYVVPLCHECHQGKNGVHSNHERGLILKREAQKQFELKQSRQEFMAIFGRNYLEDENE